MHYLLESYLEDSLNARGIEFNFAINSLERIQYGKIDHLETTLELNESALVMLREIIQINMMAIIMMYIEDLIIFLEANRSSDLSYYDLLDKKDPDVGERITEFFEHFNETNDNDYCKMLCYITFDEIGNLPLNDQKKKLLQRLIGGNISEFKKFLEDLRVFRKTHSQAFRRYKHAGLAIRHGFKSLDGNYPYTAKKFDSMFLVFTGEHIFKDSVPLAYSNEVIDGYKYLATGLQEIIKEIVLNKMTCLERHIEGLPPYENYSPVTFTNQEKDEIVSFIIEFALQNPIKAETGNITPSSQVTKDKVQWYAELDCFLDRCKNNLQIFSHKRDKLVDEEMSNTTI
jgi:hypothetical protein